MFLLIYHIIHIIDDNRNNLGQLGVRKRTMFLVVNSNFQE